MSHVVVTHGQALPAVLCASRADSLASAILVSRLFVRTRFATICRLGKPSEAAARTPHPSSVAAAVSVKGLQTVQYLKHAPCHQAAVIHAPNDRRMHQARSSRIPA